MDARIWLGPDRPAQVVAAVERGGGSLVPLSDANAIVWLSRDHVRFDDLHPIRGALKPEIRWIQLDSAGVERWFEAGLVDRDRVWTGAQGAYGAICAEHVVALVLAAAKRLPQLARQTSWSELGGERLEGKTVGIVGAGGIGRETIIRLAAFGVQTVALTRSGRLVEGADRSVGPDGLHELLAQSDYVVLTAPLTGETTGLIGASELELIGSHGWLINVSRGALVDTDALVAALDAGAIAGACLDVTDPEPLPPGHPLWTLPNVLVTPHVANTWETLVESFAERVAENVRRFSAGRELLGVIDPELGVLMPLETEADAVVIVPAVLREHVHAILEGVGARSRDAASVAESLVAANLAGHDSHGVLLLSYYVDLIRAGHIRLDAIPEVVLDRGSMVALDGHHGFGQVVGRAAVELAITRGQEHGIACILGRNASHLGRLGEYTSSIADAGLVAILLCNFQGGEQQLAPFGGAERRLTNNPISLAAPGHTDPVLLDMALGVVAGGKVWLAKARGESMPEGWIVGPDGQPSTDPDDLDAGGTLLPLGGREAGHKGYGLIVLVDILAGILSGGGICRPEAGRFSNAFLLVAIDVPPIVEPDRYDAELQILTEHLKSSRRLSGVDEILLPGESEARTAERRATEGIPIEASTWRSLVQLGNDLGVEAPIT